MLNWWVMYKMFYISQGSYKEKQDAAACVWYTVFKSQGSDANLGKFMHSS